MNLIDGKKISQKIILDLKKEIVERKIQPCLGVILVGDDPASKIYVQKKEEAAKSIGIKVKSHFLSRGASEKEALDIVNSLNQDKQVNGILVQMPLPKHISSDKIIKAISLKKDVDGFLSESEFSSPFILSIQEAIKSTGEKMENKEILALVNSDIFGQRLVGFFKDKVLTIGVEVGPLQRSDLKLGFADIIITALGQPEIIKSSMIKQGAILIDGGISKKNGKIIGDIDRVSVEEKASWLSPVPGGLGPMTVAFLLKNVVLAVK